MSTARELQAFDYVNQPYAAVRDAMIASPLTVFRQATTAAATTHGTEEVGGELHARVGPLAIGAPVSIDVLAVDESRSADGKPRTTLAIEVHATRQAALFPTLRATLAIYPLTATETQLELDGAYDPPLGILGDAIDAIAMHRIAEQSITGFVRDVATLLRGLLSAGHAA